MNKGLFRSLILVFLLLSGGGFFLGSVTYWSVFAAGLLCFLGAVIKDKNRKSHIARPHQRNAQSVRAIKAELEYNLQTAQAAQACLKTYQAPAPENLSGRKNPLIGDFSTASRDSLGSELTAAIQDTRLLAEIAAVYSDYVSLRALFVTVRGDLPAKQSGGSCAFQKDISSYPWYTGVMNGLARIIRESKIILIQI